MRTFSQKQNQPQKKVSSSLALSNMATPGPDHREHPILHLQRTIGNQAVLRMWQTHAEGAEEPGVGLTAAASPRFGHDFSRIPIHPPTAGGIQTKLAINQPGDEYEQEADHISEQVMRKPEPQLRRACACGGGCPRCQTEHPGQEHQRLQTKHVGSSDSGQAAAPPIVHDVLASPGQPLDPATRAFVEPRFGHDFSHVRVHTDPKAEESAGAMNALAYTVGRDLVFARGQYAPGTASGRRLLTHELAHVTQQDAVGNGVGYGLFRKKDEGKPQAPPPAPKAPPPTTKAPPPTTAATPCVPKFKSLEAKITGSVGVREVNGKCQLMLGTPGKTNGATFTSKVDLPAGCTGTLQYVQLVDMCRSLHLTTGKDLRRKTGGDWIDTQDPVDQQQVSSEGSVEFKADDSPGQPLAEIADHVHAKDSFKIWLMWKPDQPADANRVPLAMATWNWSGEAKVKKPDEQDCTKRWVLTQHGLNGGIGKATKDSPAATKTVKSGDPPIEEAKEAKC
jgi:hypothetical protein